MTVSTRNKNNSVPIYIYGALQKAIRLDIYVYSISLSTIGKIFSLMKQDECTLQCQLHFNDVFVFRAQTSAAPLDYIRFFLSHVVFHESNSFFFLLSSLFFSLELHMISLTCTDRPLSAHDQPSTCAHDQPSTQLPTLAPIIIFSFCIFFFYVVGFSLFVFFLFSTHIPSLPSFNIKCRKSHLINPM